MKSFLTPFLWPFLWPALILARVFGNSPDFWLNVQRRTDLWNAMHSPRDRKRIERARPLTDAARWPLENTNASGSRCFHTISYCVDSGPGVCPDVFEVTDWVERQRIADALHAY